MAIEPLEWSESTATKKKGPDEPKGLARRNFLKLIGAAAAGVGFASPLGPLVSSKASEVPPPGGGHHSPKEGKRVRQWAMAIDLRRCEACTTIGQAPACTEACIKEHYVPEGQKWIEVYKQELPGGGSYFQPTPCMNCENAPCSNVCPVAATYHTEEGVVLIDHQRCIGCRLCMAACPYQRRFFNWGDPELPPQAYFAEYSPETAVPAIRGTVMKCTFCPHRLRAGSLPACAEGCPMKAIYVGDLVEDVATNGVDVVKFSTFLAENNAYRYKEELGTKPRVWYIPGHGQAFGRRATDPKLQESKPVEWKYEMPDWQKHQGRTGS